MGFWEEVEQVLPRGRPEQTEERASLAEWQLADQLGAEWDYMASPAPDNIILGWGHRQGREVLVGCHDNRHLLTVGGTRSGKAVSLLIPNLLYYGTALAGGKGQGGSVLAIDPKGELAELTLKTRRDVIGQRCFVLDPFNASGFGGAASDGFNPMAELGRYSDDSIDKAALIADALVQPAKHDAHWGESARMFVRALVLFCLMDRPGAHLGDVRDWLMLRHDHLAQARQRMVPAERGELKPGQAWPAWYDSDEMLLYELMKRAGTFKAFPYAHVVAGMGAAFATLGSRERASIISTARTQTEFLDSGPLKEVLKKHSFRIADLKEGIEEPDGTRRNVTVYLCLQAKHLGYYSRWLRVITNLAFAGLEGEKNKPDVPTLLVLDELGTALGFMQAIESGAGLLAGSGVRMWSVLQDLTQLKRHYDETWETFIGNAGVVTFFGNSDQTTLNYVSGRLGSRRIKEKTSNPQTRGQAEQGGHPDKESLGTEPLWSTVEIEQGLRREKGGMLVLQAGEKPVLLRKVVYYEEEPFKSRMKSGRR